ATPTRSAATRRSPSTRSSSSPTRRSPTRASATSSAAPTWSSAASTARTTSRAAAPSWRNASRPSPAPERLTRPAQTPKARVPAASWEAPPGCGVGILTDDFSDPKRAFSGVGGTARSDQALRVGGGGRRGLAQDRAWPAGLPARPLGLRQDHDAAADRGLRRAERRRDRGWRQGRVLAGAHAAAREPQHVDDLPELRAVAAHDGGRQRRLRAHLAEDAARRNR